MSKLSIILGLLLYNTSVVAVESFEIQTTVYRSGWNYYCDESEDEKLEYTRLKLDYLANEECPKFARHIETTSFDYSCIPLGDVFVKYVGTISAVYECEQ